MSEQEVYLRFIDWLRGYWLDVPDADELMPLIQATYTPDEAALLTGMPFKGRNLEELAELKGIDRVELRQKLDELAWKGLVFRTVKGDTIRYSLNDSLFTYLRTVFWPGRDDEASKNMAPLVNQYYYHGFWDQFSLTHFKTLRALPLEGTIEDTRQVLPYEEVAKVLDSKEYFAVSTCACRHRKALDSHSHDCQYPGAGGTAEVCLHFDRLATYTVENGMGREITRQEAGEILRQSAEAGLVHGVSNWQEGVDTICNCCRDCCLFFEAFHILKHAEGMAPSNYLVRIDPEKCIGDGKCVRRCPMGALRLEDYPEARDRITRVAARNKDGEVELKNKTGKVAVLDPDLCIGCGVCAYTCMTQSMVLERREVTEDPPLDVPTYMKLISADFAAGKARLQQGED